MQQPFSNQPPAQPQVDSGQVAFKQGLIYGSILGVVGIIFVIISALLSVSNVEGMTGTHSTNPLSGTSLLSWLLSFLLFIIGVGLFLLAGTMASRKTGLVRTGTFAGLWAGVIYGVVELITRLIMDFSYTLPRTIDAYHRHLTTNINALQPVLIGVLIIGAVFGLLFAVGFGAGFGALGGLIGRSSSKNKRPPALYQAQMYQGMGQPPYQPYGQPTPGYGQPYGQQPTNYGQAVPGYGQPQQPNNMYGNQPQPQQPNNMYGNQPQPQQPAMMPKNDSVEPTVRAGDDYRYRQQSNQSANEQENQSPSDAQQPPIDADATMRADNPYREHSSNNNQPEQ